MAQAVPKPAWKHFTITQLYPSLPASKPCIETQLSLTFDQSYKVLIALAGSEVD